VKVTTTPFEGLLILEPTVFTDSRGYFFESFNEATFKKVTGYNTLWIQDNQALSSKNVLRGLHYQNNPNAQAKLVRALSGDIWDVVVDLRKDQPTYKQWMGVLLTAENKKQFLIPRGFAHGYSVLSDQAEILYKCDGLYSKADEGGIIYNDPELQIDWKIDLSQAIISEKDLAQPLLKDCNSLF
jgi:dTDP-4-dehydrorhamnose 3,5-epimerase